MSRFWLITTWCLFTVTFILTSLAVASWVSDITFAPLAYLSVVGFLATTISAVFGFFVRD